MSGLAAGRTGARVLVFAAAMLLTAQAEPLSAQVPIEVEPGMPFAAPPPELLNARRQRLLDSIGTGVAILKSAAMKSIEGDYPQDSDFRQENDFFYLTGLETPDSWLLLAARPDGSRSETLFIPERHPAQEQWTGRKPSFAEATTVSGIRDVRAAGGFSQSLGRSGGLPLPRGVPIYLPLNRKARGDPVFERLVFDSGAQVRDLDPVMARLRLVKDEFEIRMLRRAIGITTGAQRAAMEVARPGMYEYELEAVIEFNFRKGGAERLGFPSIIGSGPNSVVLHYDKSRRRMEAGDLVVMDVGAEYSYYSADVTRTIPVTGRFTSRQRRIYDLVLATQNAAMEAVRPGATMAQLGRVARAYLREHSGDACGSRTCDAYFVHGLGHWLGMDVHDVGDYSTPLRAGMVITVEPGIYLPEENLGVRIEDDVLVTESGYEVLSRAAPTNPAEIEALIQSDR